MWIETNLRDDGLTNWFVSFHLKIQIYCVMETQRATKPARVQKTSQLVANSFQYLRCAINIHSIVMRIDYCQKKSIRLEKVTFSSWGQLTGNLLCVSRFFLFLWVFLDESTSWSTCMHFYCHSKLQLQSCSAKALNSSVNTSPMCLHGFPITNANET